MVASAAVLVASLFFIVYAMHTGWEAVRARFWHPNYWVLTVALLMYPLGFIPVLWGWHTIMDRVGGCQDMRMNVRLYSLSCLPKRIPGFVWYIGSRLVLYRECQVGYSTTLVATAIETILLTLSGLFVYVLSLLWTSAELDPKLRETTVVALVLALAALVWTPILHRGLGWLLAHLGMPGGVKIRRRDVLYLLGIFSLGWAGGGLVLYILSTGVTTLPPGQLPTVIGAWGAAGAVSLTAGLLVHGMGLREVTLAVLLSRHLPLSVAVVISLLFRLVLTIGEFIWALIFIGLAKVFPD